MESQTKPPRDGHRARYYLPQHVLVETQAFLRDCGRDECEGTGLWIGRPDGDGGVRLTRFFAPEQVCRKSLFGMTVEYTERAHFTLPDELTEGELFYARVHSHPGRAYHSDCDNQNAVLTHEGALSVVVPDFAVRPIELTRCAVFRLDYGRGWVRLTHDEVLQTFEVIP